ncbi:MAG: NfeD family protein [Cyanobacteria bacterium J06634_6]
MFTTKRDNRSNQAPSKSFYKPDRLASKTAKIVENFDYQKGYGWVRWNGNLWRAKSKDHFWRVGEKVAVVRVGGDNILRVRVLQKEVQQVAAA